MCTLEEKSIWEKLKKTKQRELAYQVLYKAQNPLDAAEIYCLMKQKEPSCCYAVSTVYRILLAFEEKNLVVRTSIPDSDAALYEWNRGVHKHYAVCLKCHKRIPFPVCPFESMQSSVKGCEGFTVTGHKIEIYGYCDNCTR